MAVGTFEIVDGILRRYAPAQWGQVGVVTRYLVRWCPNRWQLL